MEGGSCVDTNVTYICNASNTVHVWSISGTLLQNIAVLPDSAVNKQVPPFIITSREQQCGPI